MSQIGDDDDGGGDRWHGEERMGVPTFPWPPPFYRPQPTLTAVCIAHVCSQHVNLCVHTNSSATLTVHCCVHGAWCNFCSLYTLCTLTVCISACALNMLCSCLCVQCVLCRQKFKTLCSVTSNPGWDPVEGSHHAFYARGLQVSSFYLVTSIIIPVIIKF